MKQLLIRFWRWLGRLLGLEPATYDKGQAPPPAGQPPQATTPGAPPSSPVTLPPPPAPQFDLHTGQPPVFSRKASVLTKPEQRLYHALLLAVEGDYRILPKVRLWDFIWLENDPPDRKQHLGRLSCRHVDFLLCEATKLEPLLAIELDDSSHQKPEAKEADRYKDELFAAAGLPCLRIDSPDVNSRILREQIDTKLTSNGIPT
jgi:hypothetical protein